MLTFICPHLKIIYDSDAASGLTGRNEVGAFLVLTFEGWQNFTSGSNFAQGDDGSGLENGEEN